LLAVGFLLILSVFPAPTTAESNEYTTLILTESKVFDTGDNATIEIRFFNRDIPVDADDINITITNPPPGRYIEVDEEAAKIETGIYRVTFTIEEEPTTSGVDGKVRCTKSTSRGETSHTAYFSLVTYIPEQTFRAKLAAGKPRFQAGDTVRFSVIFTNGSNEESVDPEEINTALWVNGMYQDVTLTRDNVGEYHYDYVSPEDTESKEVRFEVDAGYDNDYVYDICEASLDYYHLWLHKESMDGSSFQGEVGVCGLDGIALDADVEVTYRYCNDSGETIEKSSNGKTGMDGLLGIDLDYADIGGNEDVLDITIWANGTGTRNGDYQQYGHESIEIPRFLRESYGDGFDVVPGQGEYVPKNTDITLNYSAYLNGTSLPGKDIYYYFYTSPWDVMYGSKQDEKMGGVYHVGMSTTDGNGVFSVSFTTPDREARITPLFKADFNEGRSGEGDWVYAEDELFVSSIFDSDEDVTVGVSNFGLGKKATLVVNKTGLDGGRGEVSVIPVAKSISKSTLWQFMGVGELGEWEQLSGDDDEPFTGEQFSRELGVPSFFPDDMYFLIVGVISEDDDGPGVDRMNLVVVDKDGNVQDLEKEELNVTSNLPDNLDSEEQVAFTITITDSNGGKIKGARVTLETAGPAGTCKKSDSTDANGEVNCYLTAHNVSGDDGTVTVWFNATKDGYIDGHCEETIIVRAWDHPDTLHISSDLPDTMGSEEVAPFAITVTDDRGVGIENAFVTLDTAGAGGTCKKSDTTNANGEVFCYLTARYVTGKDETVTVWFNATKDGYGNGYYKETITVTAWVEPGVKVTEPKRVEFGGGATATVVAGVEGDVAVNAVIADRPGDDDPDALGIYLNVTTQGAGTLHWVNITMDYDSVPEGIEPEKLRIFYWDEGIWEWLRAGNSGCDPGKKKVWANATHLTIFAPREAHGDITPPTIVHTPVTTATENTPISITATITDEEDGVLEAELYYRKTGDTFYKKLGMNRTGDSYSAEIPGADVSVDGIQYYIKATDGNNTATHPMDYNNPHQVTVSKAEENDDDGGFLAGFGLVMILAVVGVAGVLLGRKERR